MCEVDVFKKDFPEILFQEYLADIRQAKNQQWYVGSLFTALLGFVVLNSGLWSNCMTIPKVLLIVGVVATSFGIFWYQRDIEYYRSCKDLLRYDREWKVDSMHRYKSLTRDMKGKCWRVFWLVLGSTLFGTISLGSSLYF
jgi:hypothetical protein